MTEPGLAEPHDAHLAPTRVPSGPSNNGSEGDIDVVAALAAAERASKRRRWPTLLLGAVLGGAGTLGVIFLAGNRDSTDVVDREEVQLAVAQVSQQDLVEEIEWAGTLGYGETVSVSGAGGTITTVAPIGSTIERGDIIATVDSLPVVVLFGDTPFWRNLSEGAEGRDVYQLETNLSALGYDPDRSVDIDETFTANTAQMVERWQEDLGIEATGDVPMGRAVIVEGPSSLVSVGAVGGAATGELASLAPRRSVVDVVSTIDGTVTEPLAVGSSLSHGSTVYLVDEIPVVALTDLDAVSAEFISDTFTTLELEAALAEGGYDPDAEMTVDGTVTDATRAAIERWQNAAGVPVTGQDDPGYYVAVPERRVVESILIADGSLVTAGGPILTASISRLSVQVVVEVADADEFEVGQDVTIELADETTAVGVVVDISEVAQGATPQDSPTVEISVDVFAEADQNLIEGPVTVLNAGEIIEGATVVPTRALVALAEGGFAVERINADGSRSLVGIELGTFDDGVVEVVGGDVSPGDNVVVPE